VYLKSIEMYGFKSFAERAEIKFKEGIAGIVGPNGSGKSNITDAVRWVLGEQSAKVLRGNKMEDLIFSGTDRRKQLGMAEVSLTFDNGEGNLPIEYGEVIVKRRVYRSGESEYLINNNPCKLREIKDLFMDTGIGIDGYSIIGQGKIDSILNSKSEDRRKLFEEAAGIVKYKTRKENTGKKLDNTNKNILRVEDILDELETRIGPLKDEAEKAKKYEEYYGELKGLEISLFMEEIDRINEKTKANRDKLEAVQDNIASLKLKKSELVNELGETESLLESLRAELKEDEKKLFNANEKRNQLNYEIDLIAEKKRSATKEQIKLENQMTEYGEERKRLESELDAKKNLMRDSVENKIRLEKDIFEEEVKIKEVAKKLIVEKEQLQKNKSKIFDNFNKSSELKSELARLDSYEKSGKKRMIRLDEETIEIEKSVSSSIAKKERLEAELSGLEKRRIKGADKQTLLEEVVENNKNLENTKKITISDIEGKLKTLKEKRNFYKKMIANYEGFNSSVKNSLKALRGSGLEKHLEGTVSDIIKVDKIYEVALETALGYSSQHIICDTVDSARKIITFAKQEKTGRITLLPMSDVRARRNSGKSIMQDDGIVGRAEELIDYDNKFENIVSFLLGNILIVRDSSTAARLLKKGYKGSRLITLDGEVFNPGGTITGGSVKVRSAGLLSRKRIFEETSKEIIKYEKVLKEETNKFDKLMKEKILSERKFSENENEINKIEREIEKTNESLRALIIYMQTLKDKQAILNNELKDIQAEANHLQDRRLSIAEKLKEIEEQSMNQERSTEESEKSEKELVNTMDELKDSLNEKRVEHAILLEKNKSAESEILRVSLAIENMEADVQGHGSQVKELLNKVVHYEGEMSAKEKILNELALTIKELEIKNEKNGMAIEENSALARGAQEQLERIDENVFNEKEKYHKLEMADTRNQMNYDHFIKQLWEVYQLSYIEAVERRIGITNRSQMVKRINILKSEIELLGEINKSSINEYDEVLRRYEFLSKQKCDLMEAKETLEDLIVKLEEKMIKIFKEEIKEINSNFDKTFNQLFNGGRAEIIFEDTDDILNSHIDIYAEPPGKKLQNLNLLSGGEKSLTAIAMLFAILMKKPSPFCVLDEIEAALDDVNVYKFASFLKKFTGNSQFILITHRKGTMEIADVLYGVTMEEKGISKIVSLEIQNKAS